MGWRPRAGRSKGYRGQSASGTRSRRLAPTGALAATRTRARHEPLGTGVGRTGNDSDSEGVPLVVG